MHATRIGLNRLLHERAQTAEIDDGVELAVDFIAAHAVKHSAQVNVVPAGVLRVKAEPKLKNRGDAARHLDRATRCIEDAGDDLKQSALAGPIRADDAEHLTTFDVEAHIIKRTKCAMPLLPCEDLKGKIGRPLIDMEVFGDVSNSDRDV